MANDEFKAEMIHVVESLGDDADLSTLIGVLSEIRMIEAGIADGEAGRVRSHAEVERFFAPILGAMVADAGDDAG